MARGRKEIDGSKVFLICPLCSKDFWRYRSTIRKESKNIYCSVLCKCEHQKETLIGENNPNFGNAWSEELKLAQSSRMINASEETKFKIGKASKEKFTEEYKARWRKHMEDLGYWMRQEDKAPFKIYQEQSEWISKMWNIIEDNRVLIENGVYSPTKNVNGAVRDHIYSRWDGFYNRVFPEILRHPCNCRIINSMDNVRKGNKSKISLEELFIEIENYDKEWIEQDKVLDYIKRYRLGDRY